jgi:hypothetical protein
MEGLRVGSLLRELEKRNKRVDCVDRKKDVFALLKIASLNPLRLHHVVSRNQVEERVVSLLETVRRPANAVYFDAGEPH